MPVNNQLYLIQKFKIQYWYSFIKKSHIQVLFGADNSRMQNTNAIKVIHYSRGSNGQPTPRIFTETSRILPSGTAGTIQNGSQLVPLMQVPITVKY